MRAKGAVSQTYTCNRVQLGFSSLQALQWINDIYNGSMLVGLLCEDEIRHLS